MDTELLVQKTMSELIKDQLVQSAHDVSDGGLFITLLESAMPRNLGFEIQSDSSVRKDAFLFGESQSRIVISISTSNKENVEQKFKEMKCEFSFLGTVIESKLMVDNEEFGETKTLAHSYNTALNEFFN